MILFVSFIIILLLIVCLFILNKSNLSFKKCLEGMSNKKRKHIINNNIKQLKKSQTYPILSNLGIEPETSNWIKYDDDTTMLYGDLENKKNIVETFEGGKGVFVNYQVDEYPPEIINKIKKCKMIDSCDGIDKNTNCGYCPTTDTYMYFDNEDFPKGLPGGCSVDLIKTTEKCEILDCNKLQSCSDISLKGKKNKCGYCPTTTKVVPLKQQGDKNISKYNFGETKCERDLVYGEECADYDNDSCKLSRYSNLKPNYNCIDDTMKKLGCENPKTKQTYNNDYNITYKSMVESIKNYITNMSSNNYNVAKTSHEACRGHSNDIDPCDSKYIKETGEYPNECYMANGYYDTDKEGFKDRNFLEYCKKSAIGYKSLMENDLSEHKKLLNGIEGKNINMNDINEYTNYLKQIKNYTRGIGLEKFNRSVSEEKAIQKRAADFCTNGSFQERGPLRIGDKIKMKKQGIYWVGYIFEEVGDNNVTIMWTEQWDKNDKMLKKRTIKNDEEARNIWGWPGKEYYSRQLLPGKKTYNKNLLKLVKKCDLAGTSKCVMSCDRMIQILKDRYPEPRDCIVTPWHEPNDPNPNNPSKEWSDCNEPCKSGDNNPKKTSVRKILQQAARGGKQCPKTLIKHKACNTHICLDSDFKEASKITMKKNTYGCPMQTFTYIGKRGRYNNVWKGDGNDMRYLNEVKKKNDESTLYCCKQTNNCSGAHGGWFSRFSNTDKNIIKNI